MQDAPNLFELRDNDTLNEELLRFERMYTEDSKHPGDLNNGFQSFSSAIKHIITTADKNELSNQECVAINTISH